MRASEAREMVNGVHGRICEMFPMFFVSGWKYKGFEPDEMGGIGRVVILRFEKAIRGKVGYVEIQVSEFSFNNPAYDLKSFIIEQIRAQELALIERRQRELDCAA